MSSRHFQRDQAHFRRTMRRGLSHVPLVATGLGCLLTSLALLRPPALAQAPSYVGYGVSTESPAASREAAEVLRTGGTAADAAVVAALMAGVSAPTSSGIGGGGFVVGWHPKSGPYVIDFRETGSAGIERAPFDSRPLNRKEVGHLVGVPGEIRGLYALHQKAGKKSWADLVGRAARKAKNGFTVGGHMANMLVYARSKVEKLPGFGPVFYPGGKPALAGSRMTRPLLAKTLDSIAKKGPSAFYTGELAQKMVDAARAHGGTLSLADLEAYRSKEREALAVNYDGKTVYTMPPPSAGGLMMVQSLKMFPADYLRSLGHGTPAYQHVLAEAMRGAVADRMRYLGDPDHQKVDLKFLLGDARLEKRRESIVLDRTHSIPRFGLEEKGTHALVIADRSGHVISMTTTVNHLFGAKIFVEGTGIILNNELDDFTARSSVLPFGMKETPNRPRAHARPVSSMTPTIVIENGAPLLALGGSGGTAIATNATQTLLAALVFGHHPLQSVSADRIYIPTNGTHMMVEKGTSASHIADLNRRGEIVGEMPFSSTAIQMLSFEGGRVRGAADPRKHGLAITR